MDAGPSNEIRGLRARPGELSFEARIGEVERRIWLRTETEVTPNADAALAACLMPAMREGGTLTLDEPVSPKLLRTQREFQAIQRAWSRGWDHGGPPLREVEVRAPAAVPLPGEPTGRVASLFSGGVDSWSTVLDNPDLTDLIFVRGFDLLPGMHPPELRDEVERRLREGAAELGLRFHVVETNVRELTDELFPWDLVYGAAAAMVGLFMAPLFDRFLIAGDSDYEIQVPMGANQLVDQLLGTERLEIVDDGGRYSRVERTARIADHPVTQRTLRICWRNPGGAYNCGRCRKCLMTMLTLEALGKRREVTSFPAELDLEPLAEIELTKMVSLTLWEDVLDAVRAGGRADLEPAVESVVAKGKRLLRLSPGFRRRSLPGPPPTVRMAVVVPVWRQARYMAGAVRSALAQEIGTGVGVTIVDDGCPDPETERIGRLLRDADPKRVAYVRQQNRGVSAARNAGVRRAIGRWPHVEAIFLLDADNLLSPRTLAELRRTLAEQPGAAWASPALELFGATEGEWVQAKPFLPYRQLFDNQCDAGSLVRREVFEAGLWFDETLLHGFEDWEFFLRASLNGFRGALAGRCGFRYRRRSASMLSLGQLRAEDNKAEIRARHRDAYLPASLARREHAEAPRFALARCDRGDVLLTAACDLDPHVLPLAELLRPRRPGFAETPLETHLPAVTVLTTTAALDALGDERQLAEQLLRLQEAVREAPVVGLTAGGDGGEPAALAMRTRTLSSLLSAGAPIEVAQTLAAPAGRQPPALPELLLLSGLKRLAQGMPPGGLVVPKGSHSEFFEYRHVDLRQTTLPLSAADVEAPIGMEVAA